MRSQPRRQIVVVGKAWKPRALVRAQLLEEGYDVVAIEEIDELLTYLNKRISKPSLIVVDTSEFNLHEDSVEKLRALSETSKILLCVGAYDKANVDLTGFKYLLVRPFFIGELIEKVKEITEEQA